MFCAAFMFGLVIFWQQETGTKAAHKMLVKLTIVFNFIDVLRAAFLPISFHQKVTNTNYKYCKLVEEGNYC